MLDLRDVSRSALKDPVLSHVTLACEAGTPTSVLGLPANGRALLMGLLAGADRPQTGTIRLGGRDVAEVRKTKGGIIRISPFGVKPSGRPVAKVIGATAAERVGLTASMSTLVKDLDADQRLRLGIAAAFEAGPQLILLDAPAAELVGDARGRFTAELGQMLSGGPVVVLAAGAPDEARGLGGRAVVLDRGKVVQAGEAADVFAHPANLKAALATSWPALNTLGMTARAGSGVLADGSTFQPPHGVQLPDEGTCTLAFRPADTTMARAGADCLRFVARAAGEAEIGGGKFLKLEFAGSTWLAPQLATAPPLGMVMNAFIDRSRLMVFDSAGRAV